MTSRTGPAMAILYALLNLACAGSRAGDWPQWRGPDRDGRVSDGESFPETLPAQASPAWRIEAGGGHSGIVVSDGSLVYLDEREGREVAHRLDAQTGREIWRQPYAEAHKDEWGAGPRSTPFIHDGQVFVQSSRGEFRCLDLADGRIRWGVSFEKDFGAVFTGENLSQTGAATRRGNNGSGIVDGDRVFVPVGATNGASVVSFDRRTGRKTWQSQSDPMAYSSFLMREVAGVRQVIVFSAHALMGLGPDDGQLLWRVPLKTSANRHVLTPNVFEDRVIVGSHTLGMVATHIVPEGAGLRTIPAWTNRNLKINLSTPVRVGHHLYGLGPGKRLVAFDARTGQIAWSQAGFGDYASLIAQGDRLLVLTDLGELVMIDADPAGYRERGRLQVCGKTWSFPAWAGGLLYVRDEREITCWNLKSDPRPGNR